MITTAEENNMTSMYQTTDESLNKIRNNLRKQMQPWELEIIEGRIPTNERHQSYTTVQGEAGFIELLVRAREHKL